MIAALFMTVSIVPNLLGPNKAMMQTLEYLRNIVNSYADTSRNAINAIGGITYDKDMFHYFMLSLLFIRSSLKIQDIVNVEDRRVLSTLVNEVLGALDDSSAQSTVVHPLIVDELRTIQTIC